jgi:replicative DNA helicase
VVALAGEVTNTVPFDLDAEEAVLGSVLIDPECIRVLNLTPPDFFSEQNQLVYQAMLKIESPNQITVAHELVKTNKLDDIGGASYLSHLVAKCFTSIGVESYAKVVSDCAVNRAIISASGQIESLASQNLNPADVLLKASQIYTSIGKSVLSDNLITPERLALMGADRYATLSHGLKTSVKTGFEQLDYETGGMFQGEMWILGGRTGHGKTSLADHMQTQGNILFASLEMNWRGLLDRMVASELAVHPRSVRIGNYYDDFYKDIVNTLPKMAEKNLYFLGRGLNTGGGVTTDMLFKIAETMKMTHGLSAIVVDYLQLLTDGGKSPYERISIISTRVKQLLEALEIPGLILSQLSRSVEDQHNKSRRPTLTSLRESGRQEEDADVALLMFRPDKYPELLLENPELRGTAELILAKNRQGDSDISIPLMWDNDRRVYV